MAIFALTLQSERWLDEIVLKATTTGDVLGADGDNSFSLPAGLGDVALMELNIAGFSIATAIADGAFENLGVVAYINSSGSTPSQRDILGVARWYRVQATQIAAYISPDPLVLWRQDEHLQIVSTEMDTNGAPTGDYVVSAKCVRVRPIEAPAGPIQLVR